MDFDAEKFVENLLSGEAHELPSDSVKPEDLEMKLPKWFDEKKFNQGRRFYWDFIFMMTASMVMGVLAVFSIPSILVVLLGSRRSTSVYTAYKRYFSTHQHVNAWFEHELKPGSVSWRSLQTVRIRHIQAGRAASLKGTGKVSQRDVALTLFGFIGFVFLKPDKFSIRQLKAGDWDAYNHTWKVFAHMLGLEDRYNICRDTYEETRQVCQILLDRVFTPCLDNVPEYFEHMCHVTLAGLRIVINDMDPPSLIYSLKCMADVPGYVLTENDRLAFRAKLRKHQFNGEDCDEGVPSTALLQKCPIEGVPTNPPRMLYLRDYESLDDIPAYKRLSLLTKYKLAYTEIAAAFYATNIGRIITNWQLKVGLFFAVYLPYRALWFFGLRNVFVNINAESPKDDSTPKPNSEYYKPEQPQPWYKVLLSFLW